MFSFKHFFIILLLISNLSNASTPSMPEYDEAGRVLTLNNMGWMHPVIDDITKDFISYSVENKKARLLEIGASYGYASDAALKNGAEMWVNDLDERHLEIFKSNIKDEKLLSHLTLIAGDFPNKISLEADFFDAILAVRVLHFFNPEKLEKAASAMYKALKRGGKVYVVAETPYLKNWAKYIPVYEDKIKNNDPYPGYFTNLADYNSVNSKHLPKELHFLDPDVLTRVFTKAGFKIEKAVFLDRKDYPKNMQLDGRESVGLIAIKF